MAEGSGMTMADRLRLQQGASAKENSVEQHDDSCALQDGGQQTEEDLRCCMPDENDRWESTDDEYWHRLSSSAYDEEEDFEALADEYETKLYGPSVLQKKAAVKGPKKLKTRFYEVAFLEGAGDVPPSPPPPRAALTAAAAKQSPASPAEPASVPDRPPFNPKKIIAIIQRVNDQLGETVKSVKPLSQVDQLTLVSGYDHMMSTLTSQRYRQRYGYNPSEGNESSLVFGSTVPSYFANVGGQSIYWRKVLSVAGLRNLIAHGPTIFKQLQATNFAGDPAAYRGDIGLNLMRRVTGNVVDLDTVVLRCNQTTLAVINASNSHKKLPTHSSLSAFSSSSQADEIARHCATELIQQFASAFKLSNEQQQARRIHPSQMASAGSIPISSNNTQRGHCPLWHYINAGQDSFHANVPCMDDVVGALLRAPFHCLEHYAFLHCGALGGDSMTERMDAFFEDCVVDSCFNMKWKAIEEYGRSIAHRGTIVDALQRLQAQNQAIFTAEFFDADDDEQSKEIAEMQKLVAKADLMGRDKTGKVRSITNADVKAWILDPTVKI